jgi:hypothetical protein
VQSEDAFSFSSEPLQDCARRDARIPWEIVQWGSNARCALVSLPALCQAEAVMRFLRSLSHLSFVLCVSLAAACGALAAQAQENHLANKTVLIIRHAEKPDTGTVLSPAGVARAQSYAHYFHPFALDGQRLQPDTLIAGADSTDSVRPRLTLEPLSQATGIALDTRFATNAPDALVHALMDEAHGKCILIAWRHKKIAPLLKAFGADSATLLPAGTWPDEVYDWVIVLHFDAAGHVDQQRRIAEPNPLP